MGYGISYSELEQIDNALTQRTIRRAGSYRVPVPPSIKPSVLIQGAMDNFDHEENTSSGIGGSHDTILVLFQNCENADQEEVGKSCKSQDDCSKPITHILDCQKLVRVGGSRGRGEISPDYKTRKTLAQKGISDSATNEYMTWCLSRFVTHRNLPKYSSCDSANIPSFAAVNGLLLNDKSSITSVGFTPIIPHPATEYGTIFTRIKNYQDVLKQKNISAGALWCDEGVYRIAKELQLMHPTEFEDIFLALGGFHTEKAVIACVGRFLEDVGVNSVFVADEIFGPSVVSTNVMNGSHYVRAKRGMTPLSEAMSRLQLVQFFKIKDCSLYDTLLQQKVKYKELFKQEGPDSVKIKDEWEKCKGLLSHFQDDFEEFKKEGCQKSEQFRYWTLFIDEIVPVLRDLTRSHRERNWPLHLSAIQRAIPLFFAFDRTNYSRWTPLYYEDCVKLPETFPEIHAEFVQGRLVVKQTHRSGSGIPMDMALEKEYNKPAKGPGRVIGFSSRKEVVAQWNLIKHEKAQYTKFLQELCLLNDDREYSFIMNFLEQ